MKRNTTKNLTKQSGYMNALMHECMQTCSHAIILLVIVGSMTFAQFQLPKYEKYTLSNGLTVYLMEQHEVPLVYMNAIFPAGAVWDGEESGLAALTAEALLFGSKNYTKDQIEETFDFLGAGISANAGKEAAQVSISFKKGDFDQLFPIFADVIRNPSFPKTEVDKRIQRWVAELEQAKESPRGVIGNYFGKFIYGENPYGNPVDGTKNTVSALTPDDLRSFFNLHYQLSKSCISIVGDFVSEEIKLKLDQVFPPSPKVDLPLLPQQIQAGIDPFIENRVLLVNKDDSRETTFMIGSMGVAWNNPDIIQIDIINTILGGRFTSWLNTELRINTGLTYGARSTFSNRKYSGTFYILSFTGTENTSAAIDLTLKVVERLHKEGIDEETLTSAKNYIKGQFPPDYETAGSLAGLLTTMFFYGLDDSYINDFEKNIDVMTVENAKDIIAKYFPKEILQFVLIGKADEIREIAAKYGKVIERNLSEDGF